MAKYSIVELNIRNGNLLGLDFLSNNERKALELNNAIYIYRGTRSKKVYMVRQSILSIDISNIITVLKKSLIQLDLIRY